MTTRKHHNNDTISEIKFILTKLNKQNSLLHFTALKTLNNQKKQITLLNKSQREG